LFQIQKDTPIQREDVELEVDQDELYDLELLLALLEVFPLACRLYHEQEPLLLVSSRLSASLVFYQAVVGLHQKAGRLSQSV
jgi:hypothetical protein